MRPAVTTKSRFAGTVGYCIGTEINYGCIRIQPCCPARLAVGRMVRTSVDLGKDVGQIQLETVTPAGNRSEAARPEGPEGVFSIGGRINMEQDSISLGGIHKSLKNVFQSADIPPWLRDSIPLCSLDGELVAIGDWCFNERFASWLSENYSHLELAANSSVATLHSQTTTRDETLIVDPAGAVR